MGKFLRKLFRKGPLDDIDSATSLGLSALGGLETQAHKLVSAANALGAANEDLRDRIEVLTSRSQGADEVIARFQRVADKLEELVA